MTWRSFWVEKIVEYVLYENGKYRYLKFYTEMGVMAEKRMGMGELMKIKICEEAL